MKNTIKLAFGLLMAATSLALAGGDGWVTDFEAAKKQAATENKSLIIEFTGSDWCPPCKMMQKNFFSKEDWVKKAKEDFILVYLDFPNDKTGMSEELLAQNARLADEYGITGYPTVIVASASGKPYAYTGFFRGTVDEHIASLTEEKAKGLEMTKSIDAAMKLEGKERAAKLESALSDFPAQVVAGFYKNELDAIAKADPENKFVSKIKTEVSLGELESKLGELMQAGKTDEAVTTIDTFIKEQKPEGEALQKAHFYKAIVTAQKGDGAAAKQIATDAIKIAPDSEIARRLEMLAQQAEQIAEQAKKGE